MMKLAIILLVACISNAQEDACDREKHKCDTGCAGNFKWHCQASRDGRTVVEHRCECSTGSVGVCATAKEQCRLHCGDPHSFHCAAINDHIYSRYCFCGNPNSNECKSAEEACTKKCHPLKKGHFECDGKENEKLAKKPECRCKGAASLAPAVGSIFGVLLLLAQLF